MSSYTPQHRADTLDGVATRLVLELGPLQQPTLLRTACKLQVRPWPRPQRSGCALSVGRYMTRAAVTIEMLRVGT